MTEQYQIPDEIARGILANKIGMWQNTLYDAGIDFKVAEKIGDERLAAIAKERITKALKAIDLLTALLEEVKE